MPKRKLIDIELAAGDPQQTLATIYKKIAAKTDLLFGVDKEIENLPTKRHCKIPRLLSGIEILKKKNNTDIPATVSAGYGEISMGSFKNIISFLQNETTPEPLRMTSDSQFIDIGSGFGKCVIHASVQARVQKSFGVEYVQTRHEKAVEILDCLKSTMEEIKPYLDNVSFSQGDATKFKTFPYSHIYCYDYIFSESTHQAILPLIANSPFKMFICFSAPAKLKKLVGENIHRIFELVHKMRVTTTGKQMFTVYFYKKNTL